MRTFLFWASFHVLVTAIPAQAEEQKLTGSFKAYFLPLKLEKGNVYRITIEGDGFHPHLQSNLPNAVETVETGTTSVKVLSACNFTAEYSLQIVAREDGETHPGTLNYRATIERAEGDTAKDEKKLPFAVEKVHKIEAAIPKHTLKMSEDTVYTLRASAPRIQFIARLLQGDKQAHWRHSHEAARPKSGNELGLSFIPKKAGDYQLLLAPSGSYLHTLAFNLDYELELIGEKALHVFHGDLGGNDKIYSKTNKPFKSFEVKLETGQHYEAIMSEGHCFLEGPDGKVVASSKAAHGFGTEHKLAFVPKETATYRLIATMNPLELGTRIDFALALIQKKQ